MGEDAPSDNSGRSQPPQPLYCGPRFRLEMVQAATILRSPEGCLREGTFGAAVPKGYWLFVPLNLILCRGAQFRRPVTYWIPPARGLRLRCALSSACGLVEERLSFEGNNTHFRVARTLSTSLLMKPQNARMRSLRLRRARSRET